MADYTAEIEQLEAVINGATDSVTVDGMSTKWNITQARKRLKELRILDDASTAMVRPAVIGMRIGGAF